MPYVTEEADRVVVRLADESGLPYVVAEFMSRIKGEKI